LVLGAAYKKDVDDLRESPSLEIIELLLKEGAVVQYCDPYVPTARILDHLHRSVDLNKSVLKKQDCVVLATDHSNFDYKEIKNNAKLIFDSRNAFAARGIKGRNIITL
jgi:UDP-N-acetyl-D-glucosamine dehydrogenase